MSQTTQKKANTFFQASIHVFVPLMRIKKEWEADFIKNRLQIFPDSSIRNTEAELWYWELTGKEQDFSYSYCKIKEWDKTKEIVCRKLTIRLFLVRFTSRLNPKGRYYLVLGTGIDRNFSDGKVCNDKDLIYLKKAFYERGKQGLCGLTGDAPNYHDWLNTVVEQITGRKSNGHFNRHYVVNVKAAKSDYENFEKEYSEGEPQKYEEVINGADRLAYALLYGNDNIEVVPDETILEVFKNTFTNNFTQKMFAGNKTIVFFKTHSDAKCYCKDYRESPFDANFGTALNVFDICFVMEAKFKLKSIQKMMLGLHPFRTKRVLASISGYMSINPFHLAEIKKRTDYLYEALGVNDILETVMKQGTLHAESNSAKLTHKLNMRVSLLTLFTVFLAVLQLIVSILCCNTCDNNSKNLSDMCNCFFGGVELQGGCCAIIGVLLGLVLAASIITMAVYQVMSFNKLKDIERELKSLNN